jgi:hypothetical protein
LDVEKKNPEERPVAIMKNKECGRAAPILSALLIAAAALAACAPGARSGEAESDFPKITVDCEGKSAVLELGAGKEIPYVELGSKVNLDFGEKRPESVRVTEIIANPDGSRKYDEATDKALVVEYSGDNLATFGVEKNFGDALSSNSDDYLPGSAFRLYRIVCADKENGDAAYGLWLRTDPAIALDRGATPAPAAFSQAEIAAAIAPACAKIRSFGDFEIMDVWYDEAISDAVVDEYFQYGHGASNGAAKENTIVLLSDFKTDEKGGDGSFNPNAVYANWKFILIRDSENGAWKIDDWGY